MPGLPEALSTLPGHRMVPGIERLRLLGKDDIPGASFPVAVHFVTSAFRPGAGWSFTDVQSHDYDEINLLLPGAGERLRYRYEIDGEIHLADGPCAVYLPAGTGHRMEPLAGTGVFVCIRLDRAAGGPPRAAAGPAGDSCLSASSIL